MRVIVGDGLRLPLIVASGVMLIRYKPNAGSGHEDKRRPNGQ